LFSVLLSDFSSRRISSGILMVNVVMCYIVTHRWGLSNPLARKLVREDEEISTTKIRKIHEG
jgi:hypothetical protein